MKKLSETYEELGIAFDFPIEIKDANGNETYCEHSDGYWWRRECDANGDGTYYENSNGDWERREYDANRNETYFEDSDGYWERSEYDANGNETYFEEINGATRGTPRSSSCDGKVIEVDGKKYKLKEL